MPGAPARLAVSALVVRSGKVVLVQRGAGVGEGLWAPPGGKTERGERLADACFREVYEETGIRVRVLRAVSEIEVFASDRFCIVSFLATPALDGVAATAGSDARTASWYDLREAKLLPLAPGVRTLLDAMFPGVRPAAVPEG